MSLGCHTVTLRLKDARSLHNTVCNRSLCSNGPRSLEKLQEKSITNTSRNYTVRDLCFCQRWYCKSVIIGVQSWQGLSENLNENRSYRTKTSNTPMLVGSYQIPHVLVHHIQEFLDALLSYQPSYLCGLVIFFLSQTLTQAVAGAYTIWIPEKGIWRHWPSTRARHMMTRLANHVYLITYLFIHSLHSLALVSLNLSYNSLAFNGTVIICICSPMRS